MGADLKKRSSSVASTGSVALAACLVFSASVEAQLVPQLESLRPYVGKTWQAPVDAEAGVYDVARWDVALAGQAVRILHSVGAGSYGGETIIVWDGAAGSLVYFYFTTAGFYTSGTMFFDEQGVLHSHEVVTGGESGVSEVRSTQEILADGRMRVSTQMLRDGNWDDAGETIYTETPDAVVILPDSATSGESSKID